LPVNADVTPKLLSMKNICLSLSIGLLLAGSAAFAQTVATNPVGFISITVKGGTLAQPSVNLVSPTLTNPIAYQGIVASVSGTTINITGANFTADQFDGANGQFYVEVFSATQAGVLADISATGTSSVTTTQDISGLITAGESIAIRQHITINQFLGATNTYGLLGSNSDATTADNVYVYSGSSSNTYWYYTGTPGTVPSDAGWYDLGFSPAGSVTIAPSEGVLIQRRGTGDVTITSTGAVKTGNTLFPVAHGISVLGTVSAQGLTLATSGLYNGNAGITGSASDATTSDQVYIYSGNTSNQYWYYTGTPGVVPTDAGWYDLSFTSAGTVSLPAGASFVVNRINGGAFNWTLPAPTSF